MTRAAKPLNEEANNQTPRDELSALHSAIINIVYATTPMNETVVMITSADGAVGHADHLQR